MDWWMIVAVALYLLGTVLASEALLPSFSTGTSPFARTALVVLWPLMAASMAIVLLLLNIACFFTPRDH